MNCKAIIIQRCYRKRYIRNRYRKLIELLKEKEHLDYLSSYAIKIQKCYKKIFRNKKLFNLVVKIQSFYRGYKVRKITTSNLIKIPYNLLLKEMIYEKVLYKNVFYKYFRKKMLEI